MNYESDSERPLASLELVYLAAKSPLLGHLDWIQLDNSLS